MKQFALSLAVLALIGTSDAIQLEDNVFDGYMDAHKRYDMDTVVHTMSGENRDSLDGEDIPAYRLKQTARA